jgi:CRP-like cAMP-binding protein
MTVDVERIRSVPLFADFTEAEYEAVADKLEEREAATGAHLSAEGGSGYFFFVIERGAAVVTRGDETLATFGPGDFFGEGAIFRARRRTATVTTTEPTVLFAMFGADFAKLVSEIEPLHARIEDALDARLPTD